MHERMSSDFDWLWPLLTCSRLQEVFGGNAVSDEYGIGRHVANLFVTQTYEGQSDIHCKSPLWVYLDGN
jgi:alkylation response protein AidB-like acyl-CoA dehydrogenase